MQNSIDYGHLMHKALRGLMAEVLADVAEGGLPGDHHFLITFEMDHPGVDVPDWMRAQYPDEMTIVMQHWFDDLAVMPDRFSVTLNFNNTPEPLVIPFDAVRAFVDPSVEFGLRFDQPEAEDDGLTLVDDAHEDEDPGPDDATADTDAGEDDPTDNSPDRGGSGGGINLDAFRKS